MLIFLSPDLVWHLKNTFATRIFFSEFDGGAKFYLNRKPR